MKLGFEPVHRPQPHHPQMSSGPIHAYSSPDGALQQGGLAPPVGQMGSYPAGHLVGPGVITPGVTTAPYGGPGQPHVVCGSAPGMPPSVYETHNVSPTRSQPLVQPLVQSGIPLPTVPQPSILKHPGINPVSGPIGTASQGFMIPPGYTIPPPPGQYQTASTSVPTQRAGAPGYADGQAPGYATDQAPIYTVDQAPAYGASQTTDHAGNQTSGGFAPLPIHPQGPSVALGQTPGIQPGNSVFIGPAQALAYNSGRVFLPAYPTSPSKPAGRVYYSKGSGGGGGGGGDGGGGPSLPPQGARYFRDTSPEQTVRFLPVEPLAQGTPIAGHTMPRTGGVSTAMPSPIRKSLFYLYKTSSKVL